MQPDLAYYFGLHPWDLERLELGEILEHLQALERVKGSAGSGTPARRGR